MACRAGQGSIRDMDLEAVLKEYSYEYPKELIAQEPASPRDAAKLLVYDRKSEQVSMSSFAHLPEFLPKGSVLVFNETKVIPARIKVRKETGGLVELLYVKEEKGMMMAMSPRRLEPGAILSIGRRKIFRVARQEEKYYFFENLTGESLISVLEKFGDAPIPPYIKNSPLDRAKLKRKYQTVFARNLGSVAAPTASLHFTERLIDKLRKAGIKICFVTLHVNLGTFAPLTSEHLEAGELHEEIFDISEMTARTLNQAKSEGRPIIAVGTTVVRALESASQSGILKSGEGRTRLFIRDGYVPKTVNGLITNFHVPESSLLMLVSAFMGRAKLLSLYDLAIRNRFKLFSFGDGMLVI